jgi:hypothetical protein
MARRGSIAGELQHFGAKWRLLRAAGEYLLQV